ncbi:MAG: TolC family protein, partial [Pseudomonadota bacterium]
MKVPAGIFASSLAALIVGSAYAGEHARNPSTLPFFLRSSISADESPASTHIANRSQWELRNSQPSLLDQTLVGELRPGHTSESSFTGFLTSSTQRSDELLSSLYNSNADRQAVKTAAFDLLPTISLIGEISRDTRRTSVTSSINRERTKQARIEAEWVVYSGGANWAAVRAAQYAADASDWNYLATERQIILSHASIYLETIAAQNQVDAIAKTVHRLKRIRRSTKAQYQAGLTSKTDIAQVDAEIASVSSELAVAKSRLEQQRIAYQDLTGRPAPNRLKEPSLGRLIPKSKDAAVERALQSNHIINAAFATYDAAVENSKVAKGRLLPRVSLFADGSTRDERLVDQDREYDWSAGVRVNVPLVNLGNNSRYHEARARAIAADFQARDTHRRVKRDVETNWTNYQFLQKQHYQLQKQSRALKRS